jgi:hypothetical protein
VHDGAMQDDFEHVKSHGTEDKKRLINPASMSRPLSCLSLDKYFSINLVDRKTRMEPKLKTQGKQFGSCLD